jgi:hypothetical protein
VVVVLIRTFLATSEAPYQQRDGHARALGTARAASKAARSEAVTGRAALMNPTVDMTRPPPTRPPLMSSDRVVRVREGAAHGTGSVDEVIPQSRPSSANQRAGDVRTPYAGG